MRVLLVEDDPGVGELVSEDLEAQGYAIDWARDGDEAFALIGLFPFDLIVLDVMLPGRDGFELTRALREERVRVPILMLTARDALEDRVQGLELGADDYLVKPFHLNELRARVRALLRRASGEASNTVTVGRITLDIGQHRVWFDGSELILSGTEYKLLEFLALHPDSFFDREALLERVWSGDAGVSSRTVDTYIRYLRRKLAEDAIDTRRGIGYRLVG